MKGNRSSKLEFGFVNADGGGEEDEDESTFPGGTWKYKTKITLRNDGTNIWNSPATFKTVCAIDITDFPYDKQLCVMTYGSWAMDLGDIDIQPDNNPVLTSQFIENSQWAVTKSEKVREELKTDCCINPFILIKINLLLERKPAYYNLNILAPCVLLQLVNLCGFFLPPESGENIGLTITVLLAVAVFLQMVSLTLPRSSDNLPTVGVFFMVVMIESVLILLVTCLILILYKNSNDVYAPRVSPWIKSFVINKLGRLVGINKFKENKKKLGFGVSTPGNVSKVYKEGNVSEADFSMNGSDNFRDLPPSLTDSETGSKEQKFWQPRRKALVAILDQVVKIREKITQEEPVGEEDWYILMTVVNRLFCYFFVLMTICTLIGLFEVAF